MPANLSWACLWILLFGLITPAVRGASLQGNSLAGTWKAQDGTLVVLEEDGTGTLAGVEISWRATGKNRLRIKSPEGMERGRYELDGNKLTTTFSGETNVLFREVETPQAEAEVETTETPPAVQARAPALRFEGEGLVLEMRPVPPGFEGFLERSGQRHAVRAVPHQGAFFGAFLAEGKTVEFHTVKSDAQGGIELIIGEERLALSGTIVGAGRVIPPPLEGVAHEDALTTRFEHPRGFFSLDLPDGWSIAEETEDGLLINPGLKAKDSLDALIVVQFGRLEGEEANRKPHELLDTYEAEVRQAWRVQNVRLKKPTRSSTAVLVGRTPGATQEWSGKSGRQDCRFWVGGITERDCYLTVGILTLEAEQERFLPRTKRLFASIRAKAPKREPALEALLAGRRVSKSSTNSSGFFGTTYDFHPDRTVTSTMMFSGGLGIDIDVGGNVEENGPYEVVGDTVYMYFRDKQESGRLVIEDDRLVGIRFGQTLYPAN